MADVNISKYRASVVRDGSKPATPGFVVSEGQDPVDPAGTGQNHLPVTIAPTATGLSITDSQILSGAGTVGQYIRGDGSLADFPSASGGGSSVSYYLNGSVNQGTIGGVAYKELSKVPVLGTGTDFSINANGYIASFLTDAGDPNLLEIPGGNWNFETYFSASSSGGTPTFYVELYKYDGSTFTLLASNSGAPEFIAFGTTLTSYFSTLAVPTTTLALTDRLAIRYYVNHSGRTITLHTEDNHLCQVITTFTTGLTALNGLTAQVQNFAVGTSGTDFNISSATATHTFNLPTASATNRGALSSADWSTFNNKQNALGYVPVPETRTLTINGTAFDLSANRSWIVGDVRTDGSYSNPSWITALAWSKITGTPTTLSGYGITDAVPNSRTITINGVTQDLSANRSFNVGTVTSVGLSSATSGVTVGGSPVTGVGAFTLTIATASGSQQGLLSAADWTTFNNKQNALTNPVTGTGTTNYLAKFTGSTTVGNSQIFDNGTNVGINQVSPTRTLDILGASGIGTVLKLQGASGTTTYLQLAYNGATNAQSGYIGYNSSSQMQFFTNDTLAMTINSNQNVGIGTATPSSKLEIVGGDEMLYLRNSTTSTIAGRIGVRTDGGMQIYSFQSGVGYKPIMLGVDASTLTAGNVLIGTTTDAGFRLDVNGSGVFRNTLALQSSGTNAAMLSWTGSNNGLLNLYNGGSLTTQILASGNSYFNGGNVGIGTSSPSTRLHVNYTSGTGFTLSNNVSNLYSEMALVSANSGAYIFKSSSGYTSYGGANALNIFNEGQIAFHSNSVSNILYLTTGGNVLIGTTTDNGARLQVNGFSRFERGTLQFTLNPSYAGGNVYSQLQSTGALALATGADNNRLYIDTSGNVGIGTSSPGNFNGLSFASPILDVIGSLNVKGIASNGAAVINIGGETFRKAAIYTSIQDQGPYLGFAVATSGTSSSANDVMRLTSGGNVLIGTTTDNGARLQVSGNVTASGNLTINGGVFTAQPSTGTNGTYSAYLNDGGQFYVGIDNSAGSLFGKGAYAYNFFSNANRPMVFSTDGTTRLTIAGTGAATFSSSVTAGKITTSGAASLPSSSALSEAILLIQDSGSNRRLGIGSSTSGQWIQSSYPGVDGISSTLLLNPSGGNVLIGTTTDPGAKLHVNGDVRTAAPTGGSAVNWRLGTVRGGTITPNATVRVEIGGVLVDLDARYV